MSTKPERERDTRLFLLFLWIIAYCGWGNWQVNNRLLTLEGKPEDGFATVMSLLCAVVSLVLPYFIYRKP